MLLRLRIAAPLAALALMVSVGCKSRQAQSAGPPPAVPVAVGAVIQESVPIQLHAVGNVEASAVVQVKSQIAGELLKVHFVEGSDVQKGDLLFEIDPRPYQEALRQAEAALAKDEALLAQAEANLGRDLAQSKNADADAARYERLVRSGVVPQTQYDQYRTAAEALREAIRADRAAIQSARASLESDRAAVAAAKLNLSYCEIRAPISGRLGNLLVNAGNLIKANADTAMVVINQITPIFVTFGVPAQDLDAVRAAERGRKLPVDAALQSDASKAERGVLTVIDNTVDTNTGTIRLKATLGNEQRLLWPGQFVNVALTLGERSNAVLAPSEAMQAGQRGQFVYVVKADKTVEPREVTVGPTVAGKAVIEKGLQPGETVVTDGQLRLYPGARIQAVQAGKLEQQGQ